MWALANPPTLNPLESPPAFILNAQHESKVFSMYINAVITIITIVPCTTFFKYSPISMSSKTITIPNRLTNTYIIIRIASINFSSSMSCDIKTNCLIIRTLTLLRFIFPSILKPSDCF